MSAPLNMSRLIELEPLDLRIEVRGRITCEKSTVTLMSPAPSERVNKPWTTTIPSDVIFAAPSPGRECDRVQQQILKPSAQPQ